jgi:hypothetical protein
MPCQVDSGLPCCAVWTANPTMSTFNRTQVSGVCVCVCVCVCALLNQAHVCASVCHPWMVCLCVFAAYTLSNAGNRKAAELEWIDCTDADAVTHVDHPLLTSAEVENGYYTFRPRQQSTAAGINITFTHMHTHSAVTIIHTRSCVLLCSPCKPV